MAGLRLTRESILDGTLHASVRALLGPEARFATDTERRDQVRAILAGAPTAWTGARQRPSST